MLNKNNSTIIKMLESAKFDAEQAGREIYYAMTFLDYTSPARANLKIALELLGIHKPEDVGLSSSILHKKWMEYK